MKRIKHRHRFGNWLMAGGLLLIAAALLLTVYNLWDEHRAGTAVTQVMEQLQKQTPDSMLVQTPSSPAGPGESEIPDYILNPDMEMPTMDIDGNRYIGTLDIPALNLSLPVMSEWSYPKLKIAPCRYVGTAYQGNFVIAAHNYRTHFGSLGNLSAGDRVTFTDVDGNIFSYDVVEVQILNPAAIEEMVSDDWDLSLFTCTLGGKTRLTVRCDKIETGD
ncbi:MAG: sortase [Oscillospiraceae bacterium]